MDQALYLMFRANIRNLVKNKLSICREWHIQPSELDRLPYFEYEQILDEVNEVAKEQAKKNEEEQKRYNSMQKTIPNMNNLTSSIGKSLPKMTMPKFN